jgi:hypothetical protein
MDPITSPAYQIVPGLPVNIDISAYSGDTWSQKFRLKSGSPPITFDLTPYTIICWIESGYNDESYELTTTILDQTDSTSDTFGCFILSLPSDMSPYPPPANYAYDLKLSDGNTPPIITTWLAGRFFLNQDISG